MVITVGHNKLGDEMKKFVLWLIFVIAFFVAICGLFMIINGSLEMIPSEEQIEKAQIAGWMLFIVGISVDFIAVLYMGRLYERKTKAGVKRNNYEKH